MGGELTSPPEQERCQTYTEVFEQVFPYYLSIGMTYEQFWNGEVELPKYYRKAEAMRRDRQNSYLWLQGKYFYEAICDASPILHAFAKRGTKPVPYPSEPYPMTKKQAEEQTAKKEREKAAKVKAYFNAMAEKGKNK